MRLRAGSKADVARALTRIEVAADAPETAALLDACLQSSHGVSAHVIGMTGPPGVGKSTLTNALIAAWRAAGDTVAVVAVDPSSQRTGGALLGDRTRMSAPPGDPGTFIRSLASRGALGGLTALAYPALTVLRALFDKVLVETVGVGQSESDVTTVSDTVVLCIQPASGDSLQFMKAGIMEIPDIAIVTKADLGAPAERAAAEVRGALSLSGGDAGLHGPDGLNAPWQTPVLTASATTGTGITDVVTAIADHGQWLRTAGRLMPQRREQARTWVRRTIEADFGARGADCLAQSTDWLQRAETEPFATVREARQDLIVERRSGRAG